MTTSPKSEALKIAPSEADKDMPEAEANGSFNLKRNKSLSDFFGKDSDDDGMDDGNDEQQQAAASSATDDGHNSNNSNANNTNDQKKSSMTRAWSTEWCDTRVVMLGDGADGESDRDAKDRGDGGEGSAAAAAADDQPYETSECIEIPPRPLSESKWMRRDSIPPNGPSETPPSIEELKSWQFDVLSYQREALISSFASVLEYYDIPAKYSIGTDALHNFSAYAMERHNPDAAYHNWHHGVSCMHMTFLLLSLGGADAYLTDDHIFALLFAALVHDVDHAGHNNDFEVKTATDRAAQYGNDAVLENHSLTITYEEILIREGCDIFSGMKADGREEEWKALLEMAKEYVLWTDPARHGELLKTLAKKHEEASPPACTSLWSRDDPESRSLLCRMIIHAADISNPVHSNFAVVRDWCSRISTEFALQAKKESEAGLPVTPFMDGLDDEYRVSKQQIGFYQWMAIPFFTMVAKCLPDAAEVGSQCTRNKKRYEDIVAHIDDVRKSGEVKEDKGDN
mmetsp:Transcript_27749/g.80095  ORF Transcript_27749/g.80095 Transcript_27749/m.80095 type:complete len:512 (+) Transcript_27749:91-1626(+)